LKERESYGVGTAAEQLDISNIKKEIDYLDRAIAEREAPKVRGQTKDNLIKEAEDLEATMREGMPTREEMRFPGKNPGAVHKHQSWCKRNAENIERYRYIQQVLNPEAPKSIENLRRDK
jgi:hypothetical protein